MNGLNNWDMGAIRRLRGSIIRMLCVRHRNQQHRFDDVELTRMLQSFAIQVSVFDVVTCLQDMADREWVKFHSEYNEFSARTEISQIELRPSGRDLYEQSVEKHPAIDFGRG